MKTIDIRTGRPYQVHIGSGIFSRAGEYVRSVLPGAVRAAVITDSNVGPLYLKEAEKALAGAGLEVISMTIKAGEESKNIGSFAEVLSFLAAGHITRSDCVIALGGGVVGDLAGFAAASYLRGIPYVQIPTSLLAMVDSSVGGQDGRRSAGGQESRRRVPSAGCRRLRPSASRHPSGKCLPGRLRGSDQVRRSG